MNSEVELVQVEGGLVIPEDAALTALREWPIDKIEAFEDYLNAQNINERESFNADFLSDKRTEGLYCRAVRIPKGVFITGMLHKRPYIDIFIEGDITLKSFSVDGSVEDVERINSFRFFEGKVGRKRVVYAHEDTLWITVDPTEYRGEGVPPDVCVEQMSDFEVMQ